MTQNPQNGSESSKAPTPGRSKRGSFTRNRSRSMTALVSVFKAADILGKNGKAFSTTELAKKAGVSQSQAYTWLHVLRAHGFVAGRLVKSGRPSGDWKWKRRVRIIKVRSR